MKISFFGKILILVVVILILIIAFYFIRDIIIKKIYPLKYQSEIKIYSDEFDVDPYLVSSIIWVESKYDIEAVSNTGAIGLMQIMPDTGEWIASKIDVDDYSEPVLKDPSLNIRFGCWYLNYLNNRFGEDIVHVLAAYNGGPNRVADWLENEEYSKANKLVNITIKETDDYVRRVKAAYEIYTKYYTFE